MCMFVGLEIEGVRKENMMTTISLYFQSFKCQTKSKDGEHKGC